MAAPYTPDMPDSSRLEKLQRLLAAEPDDPFCLYGIAQEHAKAGDLERAIEWYDRTVAADPTHAYARFHKARLLEGLGRDAEAREELRTGLEAARSSGDAKAMSEIAGALEALGG
jgi:tetratricopeptide (TPR) repeat protein